MTPEQQRAAKLWFIERFIHSAPGRSFAYRLHELTEQETPRIQNRVRQKNARYDFAFILDTSEPFGTVINIVPRTSESRWAKGVITVNQAGLFTYVSGITYDEFKGNHDS